MPETPPKVPLRDIFRVFFTVGASSFGGGVTGWMHRITVDQRGWLTNEKFLAGLALGQVLPGANVTNMAVYIGQQLRGALGALVALVAVLMGPFFLVIAVATLYDEAIKIPGFHSAMDGIAAAAVGMVLRIGTAGASHGCRKAAPVVIAVAVFVAIGILQWPLAPVALVAAPLSVALAWPRGRRQGGADA
jgi:chromate transporter